MYAQGEAAFLFLRSLCFEAVPPRASALAASDRSASVHCGEAMLFRVTAFITVE
jgi:hypothetical protein